MAEQNADQDEDKVAEAHAEEGVEGAKVPAPDALPDPWAVVIMVEDAQIAV